MDAQRPSTDADAAVDGGGGVDQEQLAEIATALKGFASVKSPELLAAKEALELRESALRGEIRKDKPAATQLHQPVNKRQAPERKMEKQRAAVASIQEQQATHVSQLSDGQCSPSGHQQQRRMGAKQRYC